MNKCDYSKPWFHGSPLELKELLVESTITQDRELARIFSHKPSIVAEDDSGKKYHNGKLVGHIYQIDEIVNKDDVYPHPNSSMKPGEEWLIRRSLRVKKISTTVPNSEEILSDEEEAALLNRITENNS